MPVALICVGLNEQVAPVGNPDVHAYVTFLVNVPPPTGARAMVVEVLCPGLALGGSGRVDARVNS